MDKIWSRLFVYLHQNDMINLAGGVRPFAIELCSFEKMWSPHDWYSVDEISASAFDDNPASILYKSIAGRYRPVSYPDGPITPRYKFIKNAYWETFQKPCWNP